MNFQGRSEARRRAGGPCNSRETSFPGPGLAVRIVETSPENSVGQAADRIMMKLRLAELYNSVAKPGAASVSTVGVMGDERTYERVIASGR